jgi:hypothetical protein
MTVRVQTDDFDIGAEIAQLRKGNAKIGAIASFIGLVRDINEGDRVSTMTLEHYPGMTEKALEDIVAQAQGYLRCAGGASRRAFTAAGPNRAGGGHQRPSRRSVRGVRISDGLFKNPSAVLEERGHRSRRPLGGRARVG